MDYQVLSPGSIGSATLKNRVIFPSMCHQHCDGEGMLTPRYESFVRARVEGGVGAMIISTGFDGPPSRARMSLADGRHRAGWQRLVVLCRENDCRLFAQLHPFKMFYEEGAQKTTDEMTRKDIAALIDRYVRGALRAKAFGLDGVELHGAHAHEIAQFLSPHFNHRTDEYGGDWRGRSRFAVEMVRAIKAAVGADYPLIFRISSRENIPNGSVVEDTERIVPLLEEAGADAIHVSFGSHVKERYLYAPYDLPDAFNIEDIARIKAAVTIPVIAVGRIIRPETAEEILGKEQADFVAMGRALLADPELVNKIGTDRPVRRCLGCIQGCTGREDAAIFCTQEPRTGRGHELVYRPVDEARRGEKVLIAGAGVAGLEAASVLARRGLRPVVYEAAAQPGGLIRYAALPPKKQVLREMIDNRLAELEQQGVEIRLNTPLTAAEVEAQGVKTVLVATGSVPVVPSIEGIDDEKVYTADEIFENPDRAIGARVAVLGGGLVGCEAAQVLAEQGKQVTVFEMAGEIAGDLVKHRKPFFYDALAALPIDVRVGARVTRVALPRIEYAIGGFRTALDGFDAAVVALGRRGVRTLADELAGLDGVEVYVIGDAQQPAMAIDAVREAATLAASL